MDRLRVLVLEDRAADAELMVAELRRAGFTLDWHRADSEREFAAHLNPPPDLILADFHMPQFTALRALQMVKERGLDIPFIIVSGSIGEDVAVSALQEGAADYLLKDRLTRLGAAASRALEAKRLREKRRLAEEALRESEQRYRSLFEGVPVGLYQSTPSGRLLDVNPALVRMLGYPDRESLLAVNASDLYVDPSERKAWTEPLEQQGILEHYENRLRRYDGTIIWARGTSVVIRDSAGRVQYYEGTIEDVTDLRQAQEDLARERNLLRTMIDTLPEYISVKDVESRFVLANTAYVEFLGQKTPQDLVGKTVFDVFPHDLAAQCVQDDRAVLRTGQPLISQETRTVDRSNNVRWHSVSKVPLHNGAGELIGLVSIARDVTEAKRAEEQIERQLETLTALYATAQKLSQTLDLGQLAHYVVETATKVFGARFAWIGQTEPGGAIRQLAHWPTRDEYLRDLDPRWDESPTGQGPSGRAIRSGFPVVVHDVASDPSLVRRDTLLELGCKSAGAFPLISRDKPFGVLVLYATQAGFFESNRIEFFQAFCNQAAAALENARLFEEARARLQQLQALRNIDLAITASLDVRVTLTVILDQVTTHLKADAANVLLLDPYTQTLRFAINRGFRSKALQTANLRLGEGHAGRAALERRVVTVQNLAVEAGEFSRSARFSEEGFVAYFAIPLIAKGQVKGVLEVFHRQALSPTPDWLAFLEALAGQAAIAIDNSSLFDNLQRVNTDLVMAYDTTLEGWSKALDLRDKETEGHTLRVTDLTWRLARAMGVKDADLVHIRRGALLHDIGKMGIPDQILLKPGPLTDDEWTVMRKHPVYAYELLASIAYLRQALDIPYCHHEKWDGTGYPRGLREQQIPLSARIFAVVDVYDALISDRPYRPAWPKEKALAYIREQAGRHFDPEVATAFLRLDEATG